MDEYYKLNPAEMAGIGNSYLGLGGASGTGMDFNSWLGTQGLNANNGIISYGEQPSMFGQGMDWLNDNEKGIGAGLQVGGALIGLADTYWGQGKDRFDKQMQLMDQQIASNTDKLQRRDALNKAWAQYGQGLAGSTAKGQ